MGLADLMESLLVDSHVGRVAKRVIPQRKALESTLNEKQDVNSDENILAYCELIVSRVALRGISRIS